MQATVGWGMLTAKSNSKIVQAQVSVCKFSGSEEYLGTCQGQELWSLGPGICGRVAKPALQPLYAH